MSTKNTTNTEETFNFFVPIEVVSKGTNKDGKPDDTDKRWIQGIASTDDLDLQDEKVVVSGIDTSYWLKHGFFNSDHGKGPENIVGEGVDAKITPAGLWVKGFLYKDHKKAEEWWSLLNSLQVSDASRKVGFSIEGKVTRRNGNKIVACWLQNIAITASPVNTKTWAEIAKSLSQEKFCSHPWIPLNKSCTCCPENDDSCACKVHEKEEKEEKALSAGSVSGRALSPQSLEGNSKVQTYKSTNFITHEEAITYIQNTKGYSKNTAKIIADSIFVRNGLI